MTFEEILEQVREQLQREGRVAYRILKRRFDLSDDDLEDLKADLIDAKRLAADEDGKVLVWTGGAVQPAAPRTSDSGLRTPDSKHPDSGPRTPDAGLSSAERRQLTVMFCDLVGSTALSEQLDPEDLREVVRTYQQVSAAVISRFAGHMAQYLGDGLLVYFGYPIAHEDDAQRAVRAALGIVEAIQKLSFQTIQLPRPLQVRVGIHTGLVVVGEIGSSEKREILALGETPNLAARLQGLAEPDTIAISTATHRLVQGFFTFHSLGSHILKGISTTMEIYQVLGESGMQSRFEVAVGSGLTPLVGREEELGLLRRRWEQATERAGQVVLLSGEAGIGKSRLVQELKEHVVAEGATRIEFRCSPYHQNSAFYPIIDHLQRLLQFASHETPQAKLAKLQQTLAAYRFPQADTLPLLAALLSLPHPEGSPLLTLSPQKQKQKTQEALVAWIIEEAEKAAVYCAWEDLHWADPSTLEVLTLYLEQIPTTRTFTVLTFRPDFTPPCGARSYLTQLTLSRLSRTQVRKMVSYVAAQTLRPSTSSGRTESESSGETPPVRAEPVEARTALPNDLVDAVVARTDGVPLFVEELTKMVLESGLLREEDGRYVGAHGGAPIPPLAIPATLQDSLMARLDRLAPVKEIAQMGAALGREFSYELLHAVSPLEEATLRQGLRQLVEAELIYQRGLPPQATYLFKHALIQDTAYQSLLKSTRQQYHTQIAHVLEDGFPETMETHPELRAHHYTEAGLPAQAIPYWQRAGERATQRSANVEAIAHLTKGLELLKTLPDTLERTQQELTLQLTLGPALMVTRGYAAPELEKVYARARELSQQVGETPQLVRVLYGLWVFHIGRAELQTAQELAEQLFTLAQSTQDSFFLLVSRFVMSRDLQERGEFVEAREHAEQGIGLYDRYRNQPSAFQAHHCGVGCLDSIVWVLWLLGYPDQALRRAQEALTMAQEIALPMTLAEALSYLAWFHQKLRERQAAEERAAALVTLCTEQVFPLWQAEGTIVRGWALAEQGRDEEGVAQIQQGLADYRATGAEMRLPESLALLAAVYKKRGQAEEGLKVVAEALARVDKTGGRLWEAELHRLKGELTLQSRGQSLASRVKEAEECFQNALEVARQQSAKSWELRAAMSLARLWQQQGEKAEAHQLLSEIYNWFTEGFDTKDLQEAKALLEELA